MEPFTPGDTSILDRIITARRTVRQFSDEIPPKDDIASVVQAGVQAPFASISAKDIEHFRRFFIFRRGDTRISDFEQIIRQQTRLDLEQLEREMKQDDFMKSHGKVVQGLWSHVADNGIPGFTESPWLIVAAEWRGARRAEKQSLAHVMQNMWLKAVSLNLGFVLVSALESMTHNSDFCAVFGHNPGDFGYHGCRIGYPKTDPSGTPKTVDASVTWMTE